MSLGNRRASLGRGLAALIPDDVMDSSPRRPDGVRQVALDMIQPNPEQPRKHFAMEPLEELAASIREHGVMTPLVVRASTGGRYILIAGERRLRAAGLAGLTEIPVWIREGADDAGRQLELALIENVQREDLNPVELARGYQRLIETYGYTQEQVARKVGKSRVSVSNALRLLKLPTFALRLVEEGRLSAGHAKALVPVEDVEVLRAMISQILARDLSVRAAERMVRSQNRVQQTLQTTQRRAQVVHYASELLTRSLQTAVEIKPRSAGGGKIVIEYHSGEELERLIKSLRSDEA